MKEENVWMKKMVSRNTQLRILMLAILIGLIVNLSNVMKVSANTIPSQTTARTEAFDGLDAAPPNLGLNPDQFTPGDFTDYNNAYNYAKFQSADGHSNPDAVNNPLRAIRMTHYRDQQGAVWSNVEGGNYIDIGRKQTLSAWMYFGPKTHINAGDGFGDGMALVLQNDIEGTKAFAHKGTTIGSGETLGVWGLDNDESVTDPNVIANSAMPNSWALAFDSKKNSAKTSGDDFDENLPDNSYGGQHISFGVPSDPSLYVHGSDRRSTDSIFQYKTYQYFKMNQTKLKSKPVELHDGQWHHLTVIWDPRSFVITYKFNDKNRDGSPNPKMVTDYTDRIQAATFGGHEALNKNKGHLRWGFTSTSGNDYEANLIAFESIPSQVETTVTSSINDFTQNKTIDNKSTGADRTVNSGDNLAINYHLQYDSGESKWSNDAAAIKLPTNVTYTNGDANQIIGNVTYNDGSDPKAEPIYANEIDSSTGVLHHTIVKDLFKSETFTGPNIADINIYGVANNVSTDTKVPAVNSEFTGTNVITDVESQEFTIRKSKPIALALDQSNISVQNDKAAGITGTVSYNDGSAVTNSNISVHATLNGTALDTFKMNDTDASGKLNFSLPAAKLTQQVNTLTVYVEDINGNVSKTSSVIISKTGGLDLKVDDYSFGNINQVSPSMLIPRKGIWNIIVDDTRESGTKSPWILSATTDGLYNGNNPFKGNVIYKNSNGAEQNISSDSLLQIASGLKNQTGEQQTNVGSAWNSSEGIMLKTTGLNTAANYSGKMKWTLSDAV